MKKTIAKTTSLNRISSVLGFLSAQQNEQIGLIYGEPGTGKTTAAAFVSNNFNGVFITCRPAYSPYQFIKLLSREIVGIAPRSSAEGLDLIITSLIRSPRPLFFDEFEFVANSWKLLEIVRTIHDATETPILLIGMPGLLAKLKAYSLFIDRIQYFLDFPGYDLRDTDLLAKARCEVSIAPEVISQIHESAKGNARLIKRTLSHLENFALLHDLTNISLENIEGNSLLPEFSQISMQKIV